MPQKRTPNDDKMRELILFIAEKSEGDRSFGATKLNKLLFFADFSAYLQFGEAITWHRYQKLKKGPAPRALLPIIDEMKESGELKITERAHFGLKQKRAIALRSADLSAFSAPEVDLVNEIIESCWGKSASEISEDSHQFIGWQLAEENEDIPYEVALVGDRPIGDKERKFGFKYEKIAREFVKKHSS